MKVSHSRSNNDCCDLDIVTIKARYKQVERTGFEFGRLYWTRTSDLFHVKETRYQLRQETNLGNR